MWAPRMAHLVTLDHRPICDVKKSAVQSGGLQPNRKRFSLGGGGVRGQSAPQLAQKGSCHHFCRGPCSLAKGGPPSETHHRRKLHIRWPEAPDHKFWLAP